MLIPLALMSLTHLGMIVLLVLGFGFVIFWHELGHFLAAKYVGIRVEQFAVGFGQALFSWRKGIGFRMGNTQKDYREKVEKYLMERRPATPGEPAPEFSDTEVNAAATELGLGETEYRLNWIPLGGYVKMLGQDDLKPDAIAEDPKAYNKKSISARMLVISAGVIMNIILAAIGFMVLFLIGFHVQPAWVGNMLPGSPYQKAGGQVGDQLITYDGNSEDDFTKITLDTALSKENTKVEVVVDRPVGDGTKFERVTLWVTPAKSTGDANFLQIGFVYPIRLEGVNPADAVPMDEAKKAKLRQTTPEEVLLVTPGDKVTAIKIEGDSQSISVAPEDYVKFYRMLQQAHGRRLNLTILGADGKVRTDQFLQPHFEDPFSGPFNLAGMVPRTAIGSMQENSPLVGKAKPGDVVESLNDGDPLPDPSRDQLMKRLGADGASGVALRLDLLRDGQKVSVPDIKATVSLGEGRKGLGVVLTVDERSTVIAEILPDSPAKAALLQARDKITAINGTAVKTWYDVHRILSQVKAGTPVEIAYDRLGTAGKTTMTLSKEQLDTVSEAQYSSRYVQWADYLKIRKTPHPWEAARWGVTETRDFILQFYLTLRRMVGGSVSPSNMMGPVGIFVAGDRFAGKGIDWLLWFLAMISANLAVVNFLPIPVVDGGQFMFLLFEKVKGKPLSPRTMAIAQYAGLAFLAAVVLFVTYHDILRFLS